MVSIIIFVNYFHVVQYAWALVKSMIAPILLVALKNYKMAWPLQSFLPRKITLLNSRMLNTLRKCEIPSLRWLGDCLICSPVE